MRWKESNDAWRLLIHIFRVAFAESVVVCIELDFKGASSSARDQELKPFYIITSLNLDTKMTDEYFHGEYCSSSGDNHVHSCALNTLS